MNGETSAQLGTTICDVLALLIPFVLIWKRKKRAILFGTISAGFFFTMPALLYPPSDPHHHLWCHGGLRDWIISSLILGLAWSLLVSGLRLLYVVVVYAWKVGRPDDLPTARVVRPGPRPPARG